MLIEHERVVYVNAAGCRLLGRSREQLVGRDYFDFVPAIDADSIEKRALARRSGGDSRQRFVECVQHPDGRKIWIEYTVDDIRLEGRVSKLITGRDVTEERRADDARRESDERFRSAFENATIGKVIASPDLRFLQVNRAFCEMLGYTEREILAMTPVDLTHPDDHGDTRAAVYRLVSGEQASTRFPKRYVHKDGRTVWVDLTTSLVRDREGRPSYFVSEILDITDHRRAAELLRDREAKLAEAQRVAHLGSWDYDVANDRLTWSEELYRIFGKDPATFTPSMHSSMRRYHPDDVKRIDTLIRRALSTGDPFEFDVRITLDNGEERVLQAIGRAELSPSGRPVRLYGVAQDITGRTRAEEALGASEQRFRNFHAQAPVMMTVIGADGRFREVSNFWLERMGYERHEAIGREAHEFITPESHRRLLEEADRTVLAGERVVRSTPLTAIRKDGATVDLLTTCLIEMDADGRFRGVVTVGVDVSHIKAAEEASRENEARYRALVEYAPEAIAVMDAETGTFIDMNAAAERLFGYTREQTLGHSPLEFCPDTQPDGTPSKEAVAQHIARVLAGETPTYVFFATHSSGREILIEVRSALLPAKGRTLIRSSITDITELKALQERVRHDDRMAAIGVLAAGVAHEVGNPLLALSMAVQSLERRPSDEYSHKKLRLISEHIERISKIVRQMSDLARPRDPKRLAVDVNRVVARALEIVRYDRRAKEVKLRFEPADDLPFVVAIEDQLMQVCLNLCLNALDAVAENPPTRPKSIDVRTSRVERDGREFVRVGFADTGPGIPAAVRPRVFQPFFTTKAPGTGTGLGLSVSHRLIEEHAGRLDFECGDESGTEFFFELPVAPAGTIRSAKENE